MWPEGWAYFASIFDAVFARGEGILTEVALPFGRPGAVEERHFRFGWSPLREDAGEVGGVLGVIAETTAEVSGARKLQAAQEEARQADQRRDEFLAILGHELRNPLAALSTALARRDRGELAGASAPEQQQLQALCQRQLRWLVRLVDDLLDVSRITRGEVQLRPQPIDLEPVVRRSALASQPALEARSHQLKLEIAPGRYTLRADAGRLEQALGNLLANAAKFTPPGGQLRLSLAMEPADGPDRISIRVHDNGLGLPPAMLEEIFLPFVQVEKALDRGNAGLGVGLTLARRLVELHGGTLTARSEGVGRGAEFILRLKVDPQPPPRPAPVAQGSGPAIRHRVLLVEDSEEIRGVFRELLEDHGHEVAVACDGPQAVQQHAEFQPDVALIDIGLPGFDGYEVARRIRAASGAAAYLVAVTGYGGKQAEALALQAGFDRHVSKPIDTDRIDELLARPPR